MTSTERSLRAKIAAHQGWAQTVDHAARTLPARRGVLDKFEREADPNNELLPAERAKRAENLRKAHYAKMALRSVEARRRRGGAA
ncbi:MAG: hypothetical protein ACLP3C_25905 [Mycobacterium sp.]|uniref:hypothetical protein n=1 Tax=Mycobacterium sp. TaxID=1785 RepID=UPI003F96186B